MINPTWVDKTGSKKVYERTKYNAFTMKFMAYFKMINNMEDELNCIKEYLAMKV